ncbi:FAD-dependent oxidoreductase [Nocardia sp. NPDC004068]|uniref:FAD-dependent oxidoreductase n=1 Tax=Nocardia sp. NPDC004068 TaxID=3364303 RepID=UPI0036BAE0A7
MRVAVIGGGISGLVAAYRLRAALGETLELTLFERRDRVGGILRTRDIEGDPVDLGAEAFVGRRPEIPALMRELGIEDQLVHPAGLRPLIWSGGAPHPLPERTLMGIPSGPDAVAGLVDDATLRRITEEPNRPLHWDRDTDTSVGALVSDRFGDQTVRRSVDPLLGGVYAGLADTIGIRAALPTLAAALDAGAPNLTQAVAAALPPPSTTPVFGGIRGGYRALLDALLTAAAPDLETTTAATKIERIGRKWRVHTATPATGTEPIADRSNVHNNLAARDHDGAALGAPVDTETAATDFERTPGGSHAVGPAAQGLGEAAPGTRAVGSAARGPREAVSGARGAGSAARGPGEAMPGARGVGSAAQGPERATPDTSPAPTDLEPGWHPGPLGEFDAVILATPAPVTARLLASVAPDAARAAEGIGTASSVVVALALPADTPLPQNSGILVATGEPLRAKAFTLSSRKWSHLAEREVALVRASFGRFGDDRPLSWSDEELIAAAVEDLATVTGIQPQPKSAVVQRWPNGLPQYAPGHTERVATIEAAVAELPGLAVAGSYLRGVGVPACAAAGTAAARRILGVAR